MLPFKDAEIVRHREREREREKERERVTERETEIERDRECFLLSTLNINDSESLGGHAIIIPHTKEHIP